MNRRKFEFYVGLFVIIGFMSVGYLVIVLGEVSLFPQKHYSLHGYFSSVSGLKNGATVEMAGVKIGQVDSISIDRERQVAKVVFKINQDMTLTDDVIASIKTSGIIGEKYIDISPGGSDTLLEDGDEIYDTESVVDLESLVRKFIFSNEDNKEEF